MPRKEIEWEWEEAFDKFGFGDGDGWNGTDIVADFIESLGYNAERDYWGIHNYMIFDIKLKDESIYTKDVDKGYDNPHDYLPRNLVRELEARFGSY
jgi:hypothetical protein